MANTEGKAETGAQPEAQGHQGIRTVRREAGTVYSSEPQEEPTLPALGSGTSGLLNCERTHFCRLKAPSLWSFVTAGPGN